MLIVGLIPATVSMFIGRAVMKGTMSRG